jgi:hypothetical protein
MKTALVVITDGRPYLAETIASLEKYLHGDFAIRIIVDDSGDPAYADMLHDTYSPEYVVLSHGTRHGLAQAVRTAWFAAVTAGASYIWHAEDDMVYTQHVYISALQELMQANPTLAQVSLKRQPVNDYELAAGGFMETHLDDFTDQDGYVLHSTLFTFNPCLIPIDVAYLCLSTQHDGLERGVTDTLLAHGWHFGVLGSKADAPMVDHIGHVRSAGWRP